MRNFWIICLGLALVTVLSLGLGFPLPALVLLFMVVAYYQASGQYAYSRILLPAAFIVPLAATSSVAAGTIFLAAALLGALLGWLIRMRASLGVSILFMTVLVFGMLAVLTAGTWDASRDEWSERIHAFAQAVDDGETSGEGMQALFTWLDAHWAYVSFGMLFGVVLLTMVMACSVLYRILDIAGLAYSDNRYFSRIRVPEHLIWAVIIVAGLWFLDQSRPNDAIRFIAWNSAVAMAVIYWINGLAVMTCMLQILNVRPLWMYSLLLGLFILNIHHIFAVVGLFDTWFDFRLKVQRLVAARQADDNPGADN